MGVNIWFDQYMNSTLINPVTFSPHLEKCRLPLVITDDFTRYAQAIPTKNQSAKTRARALFDNLICHYGFPAHPHSDQGCNFWKQSYEGPVLPLLVLISRGLPLITPWAMECQNDLIKCSLICAVLLRMTKNLTGSHFLSSLVHAYNSTMRRKYWLFAPLLNVWVTPKDLLSMLSLGIKPGPEKSDKSKYVTISRNG